jgi:hypothetical protein
MCAVLLLRVSTQLQFKKNNNSFFTSTPELSIQLYATLTLGWTSLGAERKNCPYGGSKLDPLVVQSQPGHLSDSSISWHTNVILAARNETALRQGIEIRWLDIEDKVLRTGGECTSVARTECCSETNRFQRTRRPLLSDSRKQVMWRQTNS